MSEPRILVVEDEGIVARDIRHTLERLGYAVPAVASSGEEAVEKAAETHPDLVLMDIVLQGDMDGVEAADQIRSHFDVPVVYLTAYADENLLERAKITEPFGYLLKPFQERELHATVEMALHKYKAEKAVQKSEEEARQWARENALVAEIGRNLSSTLDGDEIQRAILRWVNQGFKGEVAALLLPVDSPARRSWKLLVDASGIDAIAAARQIEEELVKGMQAVSDQLYQASEIEVIVNEKTIAERGVNDLDGSKLESFLCVPLIVGGEATGMVGVGSVSPERFGNRNLGFLSAIANQAAVAINNTRLFKALSESEQRAVTALEQLTETQRSLVQAEKLSAVGQLVAGVAHELNNPLTGVLGFSQLLLGTNLPSEVRPDVERIAWEAGRAAKIVQNLLSFARKQQVRAVFMDLNEVLAKTLEIKSYDLRVSNVQVEMKLASDLPNISADISQMQSVCLNLIGNAQEAMTGAHDGGTLRVRTARVGDKVELTIADDGPGIKPEDIDRIFDPFFTTKEVGKGTGLGLSICHGIVAEHGGRIWVESEQGSGATFHLEFPVAPETPREEVVSNTAEMATIFEGKRILVVDDEQVIRELIVATLSKLDCQVESRASASEAMELLDQASFDLLLVDLKMPGMNGKEFFQTLAERAPDLASRVIFVTGDTVSGDSEEFLEEAGRPVIGKPFDLEELERVVAEELGKVPVAQG